MVEDSRPRVRVQMYDPVPALHTLRIDLHPGRQAVPVAKAAVCLTPVHLDLLAVCPRQGHGPAIVVYRAAGYCVAVAFARVRRSATPTEEMSRMAIPHLVATRCRVLPPPTFSSASTPSVV